MLLTQAKQIPALAALFCALSFAPEAAFGADSSQGKAALVNGSAISSEDFYDELKRVERLRAREKRADQAERALTRKQVLEKLIVRELLYQEAGKRGIRVPEAAVAGELAELRKQLPGENALPDTLERMGLSEQGLRAKLERSMAVAKLIDAVSAQKGAVSEAELARYYREHPDQFQQPLRLRLSHILIKTDPSMDEEQKEELRPRLESVRRRIAAGQDFAALAREASDCYSRQKGGDLGYFLPGQLGRKMEEAARALKVGEVSGIVEDRYGLHLLKVTELQPAALLPLEQAKPGIRAKLKEEKALKALAPLVKELRAAAKVEIHLSDGEQ